MHYGEWLLVFFQWPPHLLLMLMRDPGFAGKDHFERTLTLWLQIEPRANSLTFSLKG